MNKFPGHFILFCVVGLLCSCNYMPENYAPAVTHKISLPAAPLPELIIYTPSGKKIVKKPSVWNKKTLKFSEGMPELYRVKKGDNLYTIQQKTAVPMGMIVQKNNLHFPYKIYPDQELVLVSPRIYLVEEGDSLRQVSRAQKVSVHSLVRFNNLKPPYQLQTGQKIVLPQQQYVKKDFLRNVPTLKAAGLSFQHPVKGVIVSGFGAKGKGLYNDGVNIAAAKGTPVQSAESGKVVWTVRNMRTYGNLILVRHEKGWLTAYAHLEKISVKKDQTVKKGQMIGTVGNSGVDTPQLHFEVRKGSQPVNPALYL